MTIEIFTTARCGYCDRTKAVPQIFPAGAHIGGYGDLCLLEMSGQLAEMLGAKEAP